MKNRNIPFGYQYKNGVVEIHQQEKQTIYRIIQMYRDGFSLLKIANQLNQEQIEYMPGVVSWNKSRIMRIIDDERYLGRDIYPAIIDENIHQVLIAIKANKNTQQGIDRKAAILKLNVPVICPNCGSEMYRRNDVRCKCHQRWICKNDDCTKVIAIGDDDLLEAITNCMNLIIVNPDLIRDISEGPREESVEVRRLENEIHRLLNGTNIDKDDLREKMLKCVSLKYMEIDSTPYITKKLKADFKKENPLSTFSSDLFGRTVKSITININRTVNLTLINGQKI